MLSQNGVKVPQIQQVIQQEIYAAALLREKLKSQSDSEFRIQNPKDIDEILAKGQRIIANHQYELKPSVHTLFKTGFDFQNWLFSQEEAQVKAVRLRFLERKGKMTFFKGQKTDFQ